MCGLFRITQVPLPEIHMEEDNLLQGARNMLVNCAGMKAGQRLLVLHEDPALGYFDQEIADAVLAAAGRLKIEAELQQVPFNRRVTDPEPELLSRMKVADRTLFLARLGDQIRFRDSMAEIRPIVSYALDQEMLASRFGRTDHHAFAALKDAVDHCLSSARTVRVTCRNGTDFSGSNAAFEAQGGDVTVDRFPLSVFTPVPAANFKGRLVLEGFLVGTGSQYYTPYACRLSAPLGIRFDGNRITGFDGLDKDVTAAEKHYEFVGGLYGIDPYYVHSWHAGIHPGCAYNQTAGSNFERWSGSAFGNPRLVHFHTCGAYAPGEISLNLLDPSIEVDGTCLWENGRLYPQRLKQGPEILDSFPELVRLFDEPEPACGQGENGRLTFEP